MKRSEDPEGLYIKSGGVIAAVLRLARSIVADGAYAIELCEKLEEEILRRGALPAFPCNISQGSVAAHYTPGVGDTTRIDCSNIVKIDVGAHVEGYIADAAISVTCNPSLQAMVEAAKETLAAGLDVVRAGTPLREFGRAVEGFAKSRRYKVVSNLAGHRLARYELHSGVSVPNIGAAVPGRFEAQSAYALEPFIVPGYAAGRVVDGPPSNILRLKSRRRLKDSFLRGLVEHIWAKHRGLPFASRWIYKEFGDKGLLALKDLVKLRVVYEYPMLIEASGAQVAQFEHTVYIKDSGVVVTTQSA